MGNERFSLMTFNFAKDLNKKIMTVQDTLKLAADAGIPHVDVMRVESKGVPEYRAAMEAIEILEMVRIIRISQQAPILALTDPLESTQAIALYHAGVNALMEKPIKAEVCAAQAESLIQLCLQSDEGKKRQATLAFGESLVISPRFWQVSVNGELLELTKKEFELLHFFARRPRQVFSREQLFDQIWDYNFELGGNETVKVHVNTLRKKLMVLGYSAVTEPYLLQQSEYIRWLIGSDLLLVSPTCLH